MKPTAPENAWNYDISKHFHDQFEHNQRQLLAFLWEQLAQNGGYT